MGERSILWAAGVASVVLASVAVWQTPEGTDEPSESTTRAEPERARRPSASPRSSPNAEARSRFRLRRPEAPEPEPGEPIPADDEAVAERQEWAEHLEGFSAEPRDAQWAGEAELAVHDGLESLVSRFDGHVASVECRSRRCRAQLQWPEDANVEGLSMFALHKSHEAMNCARHMRVEDDRATTLLFECEPARG